MTIDQSRAYTELIEPARQIRATAPGDGELGPQALEAEVAKAATQRDPSTLQRAKRAWEVASAVIKKGVAFAELGTRIAKLLRDIGATGWWLT